MVHIINDIIGVGAGLSAEQRQNQEHHESLTQLWTLHPLV